MAISSRYVDIYREIFNIDGIFSQPLITIGYQDINGDNIPDDFKYKDFRDLLISRGVSDITTLDLFDRRSDLKYDLNFMVPVSEYNKYSVVIDIGTLEHIFDTKQCLENCFKMTMVGGLYVLVTPVNGYFSHGFHVFNPIGLIDSIKLNGFEVIYIKYCTRDGQIINDPGTEKDVNIFTVAKKITELTSFKFPQQLKYSTMTER